MDQKRALSTKFVVQEASVRGISGIRVVEILKRAFPEGEHWTWEFVRNKEGAPQMARAINGKDEIVVTEISDEGSQVRYQKLAGTKDILWARAQNWGKDPFEQSPIEMRLGYAIAMD